jgi:hypothetical protein
MSNSREFRRITNKHVQMLMVICQRQATRIMNNIRIFFKKPVGAPIYLPEFCAYTKLDIDKVCKFLNWD